MSTESPKKHPESYDWQPKVVVIAANHVSLETSKLLDAVARKHSSQREFPVMEDEHSWWVWVDYDGLYAAKMPADLLEVIKWAHERKFEYVRLDQSGDTYESLPSYDW